MQPAFRIRPATVADLSAISAIYNESVLTDTASWAYDAETLAERSSWFADHEREYLAVLVAEASDGTIWGWGCLNHFRARAGYRFTVENSVYVAPVAQRRGVGRELLLALIAAATQRGAHVIVAGMDAANHASAKLHAALGFVEVGRLPQVGYKFDRWLDLLFMQLTIPAPDASRSDQ